MDIWHITSSNDDDGDDGVFTHKRKDPQLTVVLAHGLSAVFPRSRQKRF